MPSRGVDPGAAGAPGCSLVPAAPSAPAVAVGTAMGQEAGRPQAARTDCPGGVRAAEETAAGALPCRQGRVSSRPAGRAMLHGPFRVRLQETGR